MSKTPYTVKASMTAWPRAMSRCCENMYLAKSSTVPIQIMYSEIREIQLN